MLQVFEKLNLKNQTEIVVLNAPPSFEPEIAKLNAVTVIRDAGSVKLTEFALAFVSAQAELDRISKTLASKTRGDAIIWIAYPKKTSRRYKCEFDRDSGWTVLRNAGFDTVRSVAIDEDWTGLRFRRVEFIKSVK
jgi:hypothetical protein